MNSAGLRLAHFSDIHVTARPLGWRFRDLFTKRSTGWVNLRMLGRGARFQHAARVLGILRNELEQLRPDHLIFSGDATSLGFGPEFARAAEILDVGRENALAGLAVPGNHDYYTRRAARSGDFERCFGPWQIGKRIGAETYPFAQRVGDFWLVAVNSSKGNRWTWDASGAVGKAQLERLQKLFASLSPGPRILVTHYPLCLSSGEPEPRYRGLRDLQELIGIAEEAGVCLWLHGHRHQAYHFQSTPFASFPVICAGSATQAGHWSYGLYEITGNQLKGQRRKYSVSTQLFQELELFELTLPRVFGSG